MPIARIAHGGSPLAVRKVKLRGRWRWRARVKVRGVERKAYLSTRTEALEAEVRMRAELEQTTSGGPSPVADEEIPTLGEMFPEFIAFQQSSANKKPNRPRTIQMMEQTFRSYIEPSLGKKRVDAITIRDVDRLAANMEAGKVSKYGRKLSRNTVANALGLVRRMLAVAKRWGYVSEILEINARKHCSSRVEDDQWLTTTETKQMIPEVAEFWRPVFVLAVRTGMRLGELRALQWRDVHLDDGRSWLHIRRSWDDRVGEYGPPKGGEPREVPLTWDAAEVLRARPRGKLEDLVFPGLEGDQFSRSSYARALSLGSEAAGLHKHVHPHMTRHTFASHLVAKGVHPKIIRKWGGWLSDAMLDRYAHLAPREIDHLIDRIAPEGAPLRVIEGSETKAPSSDPDAHRSELRAVATQVATPTRQHAKRPAGAPCGPFHSRRDRN